MRIATAMLISLALIAGAKGEDATFTLRFLTPERALKAAQAALEACRRNFHQVAVAVADRAGTLQVLLRDRYAGPHTVDVAINKAWTALTFRQDTNSLALASRPDGPAAPVRHFPCVVVMGGGIPIEAGGFLLGAIAVSGAPGGEADEVCSNVGIEAIRNDIEF